MTWNCFSRPLESCVWWVLLADCATLQFQEFWELLVFDILGVAGFCN